MREETAVIHIVAKDDEAFKEVMLKIGEVLASSGVKYTLTFE